MHDYKLSNMTQQQYIIDKKGKKISVVIPLKDYNKLIEAWEELEDIKTYDAAKLKKSDPIQAQTAFEEVENYFKSRKTR